MPHPIVTAARGWTGTRFHHQGRLRKTGKHKGGVDCLGLLVGVAAELDLRGPDGKPLILGDETDYPHRPDTAKLREKLAQVLTEILLPSLRGSVATEAIQSFEIRHPGQRSVSRDWIAASAVPPRNDGLSPGDIVLLRIDESPQHLAIVSDFPPLLPPPNGGGRIGLGLIHAYAPARAVVEHALDEWWRERIEAAFRVG